MNLADLVQLPTLTVLDTLRANGEEVLLAAIMELPPSKRALIVLRADEARWLYDQGRLMGWSPSAVATL